MRSRKHLCDPDDPRSCMCCGQNVGKHARLPVRTDDQALAAREALEHLGYDVEDMLGPFRGHIEWQAPGLIEFIRARLN